MTGFKAPTSRKKLLAELNGEGAHGVEPLGMDSATFDGIWNDAHKAGSQCYQDAIANGTSRRDARGKAARVFGQRIESAVNEFCAK
jgi:hypothetical protein